MYGPNGEDVASLLDSLADIDDETAEAIADAYEAVPENERKVAQLVVRRRHRGGGLEAELWAAEHAVSDWLAAMQLDGDEFDLYSIVADAATDAVDALVLEDELADVDFATLYGPWSEIMDAEEDEEEAGEDEEAEGAAEPEPARGSRSGKAEAPGWGPGRAAPAKWGRARAEPRRPRVRVTGKAAPAKGSGPGRASAGRGSGRARARPRRPRRRPSRKASSARTPSWCCSSWPGSPP